jgi:hypothetical protein
MKSIEVTNSKAVQSLTLPWPEEGGLIELQGFNGAGKSDTLEAIDALFGRDVGKLERTDGKANGKIEGLGKSIKITAAGGRKSGALEVVSLEDGIGLGDVIDPKEKSLAAADRKAAKSLLRIIGAKVDMAKFFELVGSEEEFRKLVNSEVFLESDLVSAAGMVKRDMEQAARRAEATEKNYSQDAAAELKAANGTDLTLPDNSKELNEELERATRRREELQQKLKAAIRSKEDHERAKNELQAAKSAYSGPEVEHAKIEAEKAKSAFLVAKQKVEDAQKALEEAKLSLAYANSAQSEATQAHRSAEEYEKLIQKWSSALESTLVVEPPSDADLAGSLLLLEKAREAVETGVKVRMAKQHKAKADELTQKASEASKQGAMYRDAAKGVEKILSDALQASGGPIKVTSDDKDELRLVYTGHKRGEVFLSDLSHGERAKLVIPMVIEAIKKTGQPGGFTLPQTYWEGLTPNSRTEIVKMLTGSGVCCYTARAEDCDIKAVVLGKE